MPQGLTPAPPKSCQCRGWDTMQIPLWYHPHLDCPLQAPPEAGNSVQRNVSSESLVAAQLSTPRSQWHQRNLRPGRAKVSEHIFSELLQRISERTLSKLLQRIHLQRMWHACHMPTRSTSGCESISIAFGTMYSLSAVNIWIYFHLRHRSIKKSQVPPNQQAGMATPQKQWCPSTLALSSQVHSLKNRRIQPGESRMRDPLQLNMSSTHRQVQHNMYSAPTFAFLKNRNFETNTRIRVSYMSWC